MFYDYRFEISGSDLHSFRYDIWLSLRNDRANFGHEDFFVSRIIKYNFGTQQRRWKKAFRRRWFFAKLYSIFEKAVFRDVFLKLIFNSPIT